MRSQTLTLISRTLTLPHLYSPIRHSFLLYHAGAGEDYQRRRTEPQPSQSHSFHRRNYEEENRAAKVTVWWDFENCTIPAGINVERVAGRITAALRSSGIKGPVTITAFGDIIQMSRSTQEALTSTGVCLNHVPHSGKNSSDRSFMADLVYWVTQNPPPAHFFLISTDKDFANILHRLRMSNYNILLSSNEYATSVLYSAATIMWPWVGLVKGENVIAKHFNHPPDGLYGSWYGHYKGVLDDPFLDSEQCSVQQEESEEAEVVSETKVCPVPKAVVNGIRNVLHSYPEGMYISELRSELRRKNVPMDRNFFGYRKFSNLLSSMPTIVKFIPNPLGDGQPLVTDTRGVGLVELSSKSANGIETKVPTLAKDENLLTRDDKPPRIAPLTTVVDSAPVHDVTKVDTNASLPTSQVHDVVADGELGGRKEMTSEPPTAEKAHNPEVKEGFFKRFWTTLTGARGDHPHEKSDSISEADSTAREDAVNGDNPKRSKPKKNAAEARGSSTNSASLPTSVLGANKSDSEKKAELCERLNGTDKPRIDFFSQVASRWQSWMYGAIDQEDGSEDIKKVKSYQEADASGNCVRPFTQSNHHPETHELFSQSHFWDALESFLLSSKGSNLITKSITRDQLLRGLQKEGPCILKDLKESHLLQLADLLILDKKWVEETPSHLFPFKLVLSKKGTCRTSNDHGPNGLSSLFRRIQRLPDQGTQDQYPCNVSIEANAPKNLVELKAWFQKAYNGKKNVQPEEFHKLFESRFNKKLISSSYGYPTLQSLFFACSVGSKFDQGKKKPPSREEILSDCRKLLMDLMKESPQGFNISNFRPTFFQRYGYALECQMLGYPKLVSLLQIMPGIKIESSFIMPIEMFNSETLTDSSVDGGGKGTSLDTGGSSNGEEWDELGPVSATLHGKKNKSPEVIEQVSFSKVSLSDEELTDSEDDVPYELEGSKNRPLKREEEDSYFTQLLDSWYSSKEGDNVKEHDEVADGLIDCSRSNSQNASDLALGDSLKLKVRPQKRYKFVADSEHDEKDKLVESILKKVGDCRLQNR